MRNGSAAIASPPLFFSHKVTQGTTKPMWSLCSLWLTNKRKQTMKLNEAIKGMEVKGWERRESSNGKCVVYVRFAPKSSAPTINVKEAR